jgi:hypothetical protein
LKRIFYIISLIVLTTLIWSQIYTAQFLEYDDNYGQLIGAFLIATFLFILGIVLLIRKVRIVKMNLIATIVFLTLNSPFTVFFIVMNYENIFGVTLKVG